MKCLTYTQSRLEVNVGTSRCVLPRASHCLGFATHCHSQRPSAPAALCILSTGMAGCRLRACALLAALLAALIADASARHVLGVTSGQPPKPLLLHLNATLPAFGNGGLAAFMAAHLPGATKNGATPSTPAPGFNMTAFGDAMQQRVMSTVVADIESSACVCGNAHANMYVK